MSEPKHVVGLSGGKDSTMLAVWLTENEPRQYEFICNRTGNELPPMIEHWSNLEVRLGQPIIPVTHTTDLLQLCEDMEMLPNFRARWCTRILKIEPTIAYMEKLPPGSVLYVGLRVDEEERRGLYGEDIAIRFPLREAGFNEADVWRYLDERSIVIPDRTDCGLCYHQRISEWKSLYDNYPEHFAAGIAIEKKIGHTFRSPGRDTWPVDLESMGKAFASGREVRASKRGQKCRVCSL